ncbi:radical SAM family heme chaperone HemW [Paenibacillus sp. MER TA 81-3]|uniref:radical SAM family heme chaperone HemW n=1 Tax=Paenibacillus sp. MER TA 81-3 TaxID=2939573 RepID=UPI00203E3002|nr:radical SAM family heme chaperone HemW [Paenibacillus sp. MER TA 81-3]MCM3339636.1 radical SAM family heme chaperone HemW [Paenibacillus sp. MER TA 81-3]
MSAIQPSLQQQPYPAHAPRALYIHIPFCTNKCFYCDFNSYVLKGQPVMDYLRAMEQEMKHTVEQCPPDEIDTIFVGGGTPTVLKPDQMAYFLDSVRNAFPNWSKQIEFSMEANPGTTDIEKLRVMHAGGVNRISFGVQSFNNNLLHEIGRIHNTDDVYRSIENAQKAGFDNMSIDLMFGLPNQTVEMLEHSVEKALELDLPHLSIYSLKVEENTLFHAMYHRNELPLPSEEDELDMYMVIMERMKAAGYDQYEISNFAKPGYESRHNTTYWRNEDYYGIGAGAHGYTKRERHLNIKGVTPYVEACHNGLPRLDTFCIDEAEAMEDFMMVGLRLLEGVSSDRFAEQFGGALLDKVFAAPLKRLLKQGLIEVTSEGYRLTEQGLLFGNDVFGSFVGLLSGEK